jgi:hypothetical protein
MLDGSERIIDIATSAYRCALLTSSMRVGSFMDSSCGKKMSSVFFEPLIDVPNCETVEKLFVSTFFTAVYTNTNSLFWR